MKFGAINNSVVIEVAKFSRREQQKDRTFLRPNSEKFLPLF